MGHDSAAYTGAFSSPVFQSQSVFRALMDGMARPGTIRTHGVDVAPPAPLSAGAGSIALTLCDGDTPVWLTAGLKQSAVSAWLAFHTGAPVVDTKSDARFALVERGAILPAFSQFAAGTQDYPDRSTTIVLEVEVLAGGPELIAKGPGIDGETIVAPIGLPRVFAALWAENRTLFPRGIDLVLVAGGALLCLPRTTQFAHKEA